MYCTCPLHEHQWPLCRLPPVWALTSEQAIEIVRGSHTHPLLNIKHDPKVLLRAPKGIRAAETAIKLRNTSCRMEQKKCPWGDGFGSPGKAEHHMGAGWTAGHTISSILQSQFMSSCFIMTTLTETLCSKRAIATWTAVFDSRWGLTDNIYAPFPPQTWSKRFKCSSTYVDS